MITLGIDTSNYATSLAVVDAANKEVFCAVKKMLPVKQGQAGLRQSDAVFHHTVALPQLLRELCKENGDLLARVDAVGVAEKPRETDNSYMPCFLAGVNAATAFAAARGKTPVLTNHQSGHLAAALFYLRGMKNEFLFFHISGGTTELLLCKKTTVVKRLGKSLDLYAGQAVDRLGVRLGFSFPAGEEISRLAATCGENIKTKISIRGLDCHFSGLQNQCEQLLSDGKEPAYVAKYCLLSIADTVLAMVNGARKEYKGLPVICAGGVMASQVIQKYAASQGENLFFVPQEYSSDNAIGIAAIAAGEEGLFG